MKVGVLTVAYNEEQFVADCINQFKGFDISRHLVLISEKPWHGDALPLDNTKTIAKSLGAGVILDTWDSEAQQRNYGMEILSDCDWVLVVDADEEYKPESLKSLFKFMNEGAVLPAYGIGSLYTYWKTKEYRIDPPETGGLIVLADPMVKFTDKRCVDSEWDFLPKDIVMHHYSYVRDDAGMKKKITTFEHQHEIVPNWYENIWLKWTPKMENLHPVNPTSFKKAIKI